MQAQPLSTTDHHPELVAQIHQAIAAHPDQRIPFAEYMNLALYHPHHGYYASNRAKIGAGGDFFTSPHLGQDFGELLAEQLAECWERLQHPKPFNLIEMGAGQGLLVQDIARYLHRHHYSCFEAIAYTIVETSPGHVAEQRRYLKSLVDSWGQISWRTLEEILPDSIEGCWFSNELVDAFPVHQVVWQGGELREIYVTTAEDGQGFTEVVGELSTPQLATYFEQVGIDLSALAYAEGYRTEVNLAALDWLAQVSDRLHRGYILTIDYGYTAERYYTPGRREGTLQCYYQHAHHSNPYLNIGRQDITAHVDFTALQRQGDRLGLQTVGFTQQGLFLMALGLGDRIAALSHLEPGDLSLSDILRRREALHALINPMGLGNFGVLIQSKGLENSQPLRGLSLP